MASSGSHGEKSWQEEVRGADPGSLRPGGERPLGLSPQQGTTEVRRREPKPPGGAPRGGRTGLESVRYTPRKRGQTRLAGAIVECAFSALRPPLHRGGPKERKRGNK